MKPKTTLRNLLALAGISLLAISSASADTYTWIQTAVGSQDWTDGANWLGNAQYVSDPGNELMFFENTSTQLNPTVGTQTIINVPGSLSMNTLTRMARD